MGGDWTQNMYDTTASAPRANLYEEIDRKRAQEQVPYIAPIRRIGDVIEAENRCTPAQGATQPCPMRCNNGYLNSAGDERTIGHQHIPCWHCNPRGKNKK